MWHSDFIIQLTKKAIQTNFIWIIWTKKKTLNNIIWNFCANLPTENNLRRCIWIQIRSTFFFYSQQVEKKRRETDNTKTARGKKTKRSRERSRRERKQQTLSDDSSSHRISAVFPPSLVYSLLNQSFLRCIWYWFLFAYTTKKKIQKSSRNEIRRYFESQRISVACARRLWVSRVFFVVVVVRDSHWARVAQLSRKGRRIVFNIAEKTAAYMWTNSKSPYGMPEKKNSDRH